MYLWNIRRLREELASGRLPERARFRYLLVFVLLPFLVVPGPEEWNGWDWLDLVVAFALTWLGTKFVYEINGGDDGIRFLERYLSLGLVYSIRFFAVAFPLLLILTIVVDTVAPLPADTGPFELLTTILLLGGYFIGLGSEFRQVIEAEAAGVAPPII